MSQSQKSQKEREPLRLKNGNMEVIGVSPEEPMTIEMKFTLLNGDVKYYSKCTTI